MDTLRKLIDALGALAVFSLALYAFFGVPLWAPLPDGAEGVLRAALLYAFHAAAIIAPLARRGIA